MSGDIIMDSVIQLMENLRSVFFCDRIDHSEAKDGFVQVTEIKIKENM